MSLDEISESNIDQLSEEEVSELLRTEGVGVLGLPDDDVPYLIPMSFGYDGESVLYFIYLLFGSESRKEALTDRERRARFLVFSATSVHEWRSLSLVGSLSEVAGDEWESLRDAMANAWHPDLFSSAFPTRGIQGYRFEIDEWTGIRNTGQYR